MLLSIVPPVSTEPAVSPTRRCTGRARRCTAYYSACCSAVRHDAQTRHLAYRPPQQWFWLGFHLVEGPRGRLTPKYEHALLDHRRRDAAARRRHRRALLPAIARGIVRLVRCQIA